MTHNFFLNPVLNLSTKKHLYLIYEIKKKLLETALEKQYCVNSLIIGINHSNSILFLSYLR